MKVGDLIELSIGTKNALDLQCDHGLLLSKLPRSDDLEYDWQVLVDGQIIELGRQVEWSYMSRVVSDNV